jgi:peptidase, S41 family
MNKTFVSISTAVTAAALCLAIPTAGAAPLNNPQGHSGSSEAHHSVPADLSSQQAIPKVPEKPKDPNNPQQYATYALDLIELYGIYADKPEFAQARKDAEAKVKDAKTVKDTYSVLNDVARVAGGKHSSFRPPEDNISGTKDNTELPKVTAADGIVTAKLPSLASGPVGQEYADTAAKGLVDNMPKSCGAIIDLRSNDGGDMGPMLAGVSSLLPDGTVMQFKNRYTTTDVKIDGSSVTGGGTNTTAASKGKFTDKPVAILTNKDTASSGEATVLSFRGLSNARTFGQPTAGFTSANVPIEMPDGASLVITMAKDVARTGEEFAEEPINPDVTTDKPAEEAAAWLKQQCR